MIRLAYAALRREFEAWCSYQPAAGELPPVDGVHQMRIAARRMRAALRVFERMLPDGASAHFNAELRWFASALGETRDLDVHMLTIPELTRAAGVPADALEGYESALCRSREAARNDLRRLFASDRKRALMEGLEDLLSGPSAAALRRWQSLRIDEGAPLRLRAARRRILKRGRRVSGSDPAERLHRLRIAAKRFRYELELFAALYPSLKAPAKAAKRLQERLGEFQDACTAIERLHRFAAGIEAPGNAAKTEADAIERVLDLQRLRADAVRGAFAEEWRRFEDAVTSQSVDKAVIQRRTTPDPPAARGVNSRRTPRARARS